MAFFKYIRQARYSKAEKAALWGLGCCLSALLVLHLAEVEACSHTPQDLPKGHQDIRSHIEEGITWLATKGIKVVP